jgi:hypothetical protein
VLAFRVSAPDIETARRLIEAFTSQGFVSDVDPTECPVTVAVWTPEQWIEPVDSQAQMSREQFEIVKGEGEGEDFGRSFLGSSNDSVVMSSDSHPSSGG